MAGGVVEIESEPQLNKILADSPNKLTVIDFYATWCGPCKMIAPTFQRLADSEEYKDVNFVKCDVDKQQAVAQRYGVRVMPTFAFIKGSTVNTLEGANPQKLEGAVKANLAGTSGGTTPFSGKGQTLGGAPAPTGPAGLVNLTPQAKVLIGLIAAYVVLWYFS